MNGTTNVMMLIRREVWENRSLWIAPLVVSAVILFTSAFGGIHVGNGDDFWVGWGDHPTLAKDMEFEPGKREMIYAMTLSAFTIVQLVTLGIVVFFYLLDSLLSERKDRSILFWKSLPISDTQVVSSKLLTAMVVAPIYVLVVSALTQIAFGVIWWLRASNTLPGQVLMPWDAGVWTQMQLGFAALVPAVILWYLPLAAYLMLVSVWARKNAFLWAVLPPVAVLMVEGLLTHSNNFGEFLARRFIGIFQIMSDGAQSNSVPTIGEFLRLVGRVLGNYETWLGALAAAAFVVVIIRIRRYRDDS